MTKGRGGRAFGSQCRRILANFLAGPKSLDDSAGLDDDGTVTGSSGGNSVQSRVRGALIGLAVGDALGAAVEFSPPDTFEPVVGFRAGGPHGLKAGEWTDDTSMALALADSIASAGWDLNDQASRYVEWWKTGRYSVNGRCFDIGITTRSALSRFITSKDALASGDPSERASGNGSIMRLTPVPVGHADLYPDHIEELRGLPMNRA